MEWWVWPTVIVGLVAAFGLALVLLQWLLVGAAVTAIYAFGVLNVIGLALLILAWALWPIPMAVASMIVGAAALGHEWLTRLST